MTERHPTAATTERSERPDGGRAQQPDSSLEEPTARADVVAGDIVPVMALFAGVLLTGVLPILRFRQFYLSGDSIAQWLPVSRRIGELISNGESHLMDPSLWRGGNFVAEARFGLWNPIVLAIDATVLQLDDLSVAAMLANLIYLLILSSGVYLLAREYGANAWPSALAGLMAATGGWTLWMDAAWWTPHLSSFAFTPYVWVAARRVARAVGGPIWLFLAGALCVTAGNPYSAVVVGVVVVAVAVERGEWRNLAPLFALGGALLAIALITVFVHIPFQQTARVGSRKAELFNDGSWASGAGDLLHLSSPTALPRVRNFGRNYLGFPGAYLAWFVLPLAPWVRWRVITRREYLGLGLVGGAMVLLLLAPSNLWFFRWPMRLTPYAYLPVMIGAALVLGAGLQTDRRQQRARLTGGIIAITLYLAFAAAPVEAIWHLAGAIVVAGATIAAVRVGHRSPRSLTPGLMLSVIAVLLFQLAWRPANESVRHYSLPASAAAYDEIAAGLEGTVVQIASFDKLPQPDRDLDAAYGDLALASTYAIAGVEAVAVYSGIGFSTHDAALCLWFDGSACARAWDDLWQPAAGGDRPLADLLRADSVVVQRSVVDTAEALPPAGWSRTKVTDTAVVWRRDSRMEWPDGRLSDADGPIVAETARTDGPHRENIRVRRTGDGAGQLTFARLAWPGYEATIDGRPLQVGGGPAGLLTVAIPAEVDDGEVVLTWVPPYWRPSLLIALLGVLVGAATQLMWLRRTRRPNPDRSERPDDAA